MIRPLVTALLFVSLFAVLPGAVAAEPDTAAPDAARIEALEKRPIVLAYDWRFSPDDDPAFASPDFDDGAWPRLDPQMREGLPAAWPGIGWFRRRLDVAEDPGAVAIGFQIVHPGASEIYLDGALVARFGKLDTDPAGEVSRWFHWPRSLPLVAGREHLLAVRYSNAARRSWPDGSGRFGFHVSVLDLDRSFAELAGEKTRYKLKMGIAFAFAALHLAFFAFRPADRSHLYFALTVLGFAGLTSLGGQIDTAATAHAWRLWLRLALISGIGMMLGMVGVTQSFQVVKRPRLFAALAALAGLAALWIWFSAQEMPFYVYILVATAGITVSFIRQPSEEMSEMWRHGRLILGPGFAAAGLTGLIQVASGLGWLPRMNIADYGMLFLMLTISIHLARQWSQTETDNARKTAELEEARQLQLSLLPAAPPSVPGLEVYFEMRTATEVGGDYYDYVMESPETSGSPLVLALGDATGHGLQAGMVVIATKGLFQTALADENAGATLDRLSRGLGDMRLGRRNMAFLAARLAGGDIELAAAGMPSVWIYRAATAEVEEILLPAPPLGTLRAHRYASRRLELMPGDVLLAMSDGLGEALDASGEPLGYEALATRFTAAAGRPLAEIAAELFEAAEEWSAEGMPEDDRTVMLVKRERR